MSRFSSLALPADCFLIREPRALRGSASRLVAACKMDGQVVEAQVRQLRTAGAASVAKSERAQLPRFVVVHDGNWPRAFTEKCNHFPG